VTQPEGDAQRRSVFLTDAHWHGLQRDVVGSAATTSALVAALVARYFDHMTPEDRTEVLGEAVAIAHQRRQ
jgi:hypothetical protein